MHDQLHYLEIASMTTCHPVERISCSPQQGADIIALDEATTATTTDSKSSCGMSKSERMPLTSIMSLDSGNVDTLMNVKMPKQQEPLVEDVSPVCFLEEIFMSTQEGQIIVSHIRNNQKAGANACIVFAKPRQEDIDAYDNDVIRAVRSGDVPKLRQLHTSGKSLNACNQFGESLLHMACRRGNIKVVEYLVHEAAVRLDCRDDYGRTPLHDACWTSTPNYDVMDCLLRRCSPALLLLEDVRGHTPFHYARTEHRPKWTTFLQERRQMLSLRISLVARYVPKSTPVPSSSSSLQIESSSDNVASNDSTSIVEHPQQTPPSQDLPSPLLQHSAV
jgi:Ankyrin repeats (3 copies)